MARKLYVFDDEARRQLGNKNFLTEFTSQRAKYVDMGQKLYRMLIVNPGRLPLKADVQALLAEFLYANDNFTTLIMNKVGSLETRHGMWCGCFAAMVVEQAWADIISAPRGNP